MLVLAEALLLRPALPGSSSTSTPRPAGGFAQQAYGLTLRFGPVTEPTDRPALHHHAQGPVRQPGTWRSTARRARRDLAAHRFVVYTPMARKGQLHLAPRHANGQLHDAGARCTATPWEPGVARADQSGSGIGTLPSAMARQDVAWARLCPCCPNGSSRRPRSPSSPPAGARVPSRSAPSSTISSSKCRLTLSKAEAPPFRMNRWPVVRVGSRPAASSFLHCVVAGWLGSHRAGQREQLPPGRVTRSTTKAGHGPSPNHGGVEDSVVDSRL